MILCRSKAYFKSFPAGPAGLASARMQDSTSTARPLTKGEEIANAVTHGAGLVASLVAFPFLLAAASQRWGTPEVVGAAVFASSLVALYLVSTLYHAVRPSRAKQVLQKLDHTAIYLLIAGSYTPFTLGVLRGPWGWTLFALVWAIAGTGIALEFAFGKKVHKLAVGLYVAMGWLVVVAAKPLLALPNLFLFARGTSGRNNAVPS